MVGEFSSIKFDYLNRIEPVNTVKNLNVNKKVSNVSKSFNSYLVDALDYVNNFQNVKTDLAQQLVADPDSVNVEDVTTAMAEAKLSLELAHNVIDRVVKGWNELSVTR